MSSNQNLIVIAAFDDKRGPVPIFSTVSDVISNKVAIKSIVSTLSAREDSSKKLEGEAIIPFPDEELIGFIYYTSLDQKTETGDHRVISLTYLSPTSNANNLYSSAANLSNEARAIGQEINSHYIYGQPFQVELQNLLKAWGTKEISPEAQVPESKPKEEKHLGLHDLYTFFPAKKNDDPLSYLIIAFFQEIPVVLSGPDPQHIIDFANLLQELFHVKELRIELNLPGSAKYSQHKISKILRADMVLLTESQFRKSFFSRDPIVIITMDQELKTPYHSFDDRDIKRVSEWVKKSRDKKDPIMSSQVIRTELDQANDRLKQLIYLANSNRESSMKEISQILNSDKDEIEFLGRMALRSRKVKAEQLNKLLKTDSFTDYTDKIKESIGMINL
jgi:hypothetical protein